MHTQASILWRRLDRPGHDACHLLRHAHGHTLQGLAVFLHDDGPAALAYTVDCAPDWTTRSARVHGRIGPRTVELAIAREPDAWVLDGARFPHLAHLPDIDFGFTPATNLIQLRRVPLPLAEPVPLPVAWLDADSPALAELPQTYERRGPTELRYHAPTAGYEAILQLTPDGFIHTYPALWHAEPHPHPHPHPPTPAPTSRPPPPPPSSNPAF